ncbi:hypothetical protein QE453_000992 [Agrobacterium sp. SORGH_AS440]|nr:hypothetical protein [Agrobacterium sp. SORGH_AS_0440]
MLDIKDDFDQQRQMYSVLVLHFIEGVKQSEIAERLKPFPHQGEPHDCGRPQGGHGEDQHLQSLSAACGP